MKVVDRLLAVIAQVPLRAYKWLISPLLPASCRFVPSCSEYSRDAYRTHGFTMGSLLTSRRLLRCHPWCDGGHDPVPEQGQ
ncbi:MAG: membrane protein insertion efficiency factor YidD [Myxococcota bacterium]